MAGETIITVVGNLTADPELRFTPSGAAVASFTIASTPRTFDRNTNEWKDGEALFLRCSHLAPGGRERRRVAARAACGSSRRAGSSSARFETREGEKRTVIELDVDEVGPSLRTPRQGQPHPARLVVGRRLRRVRRRRLGGAARLPTTRGARRPAGAPAAAAAASPTSRRSRPASALDASRLCHRALLNHYTRRLSTCPSHRFASRRRSPNPLLAAKIDYIDYKDTALLRKFISDRGKIRARRVTGVSAQQQRQIAKAIKNAREMALLPYTSTAR